MHHVSQPSVRAKALTHLAEAITLAASNPVLKQHFASLFVEQAQSPSTPGAALMGAPQTPAAHRSLSSSGVPMSSLSSLPLFTPHTDATSSVGNALLRTADTVDINMNTNSTAPNSPFSPKHAGTRIIQCAICPPVTWYAERRCPAGLSLSCAAQACDPCSPFFTVEPRTLVL